MMIALLFAVVGGAVWYTVSSKKTDEKIDSVVGGKIGITDRPDLLIPEVIKKIGSLPDVSPGLQGGKMTRTYDKVFLEASNATGVPFALIKAVAQRESNFNAKAVVDEPGGQGRRAYGLMQINWWRGSNRLAFAGFPDSKIEDGNTLLDSRDNALIGAKFLLDTWQSYGNLRDCINAYNTGKPERTTIAPKNYVNDILANYNTLLGGGNLV